MLKQKEIFYRLEARVRGQKVAHDSRGAHVGIQGEGGARCRVAGRVERRSLQKSGIMPGEMIENSSFAEPVAR